MEYDFVEELVNSAYGIISLNEKNPLIEKLLNQSYETENVGCFYGENNSKQVTCRIFKVDYQGQTSYDMVKARNDAAYYAFARWDALGFNKRHAKSPYKSKSFMNMYREVCPMDSYYLLVSMEV